MDNLWQRGGSQLCPLGKGPRAQGGVALVTGSGTPGVSGSAEKVMRAKGKGDRAWIHFWWRRSTVSHWSTVSPKVVFDKNITGESGPWHD